MIQLNITFSTGWERPTLLILLLLFSCSIMSDSFVTPWTVALQAPLFMGFPRQEYRKGLLFPSPGALPDTGIKPGSPALEGGFFTTEPPGKPTTHIMHYLARQKWSRKWQLTPVFLPGEHRQRTLVSYSLWGSQRVGQDWSNLAHAQSGKTNFYLKGTQEKGEATM